MPYTEALTRALFISSTGLGVLFTETDARQGEGGFRTPYTRSHYTRGAELFYASLPKELAKQPAPLE